jgi:hypothetical protein
MLTLLGGRSTKHSVSVATHSRHGTPIQTATEIAVVELARGCTMPTTEHEKQCESCERLRAALKKIANLADSEGDEPLDDAIKIARGALTDMGRRSEQERGPVDSELTG